MKYHAKLEFGGTPHYWWNYSKDKMIRDLIIPFINGQVILISRGGYKRVLNMKNVTLLTVYRSETSLTKASKDKIPAEFKDDDFEREHECTAEIINEIKNTKTDAPIQSILQKAFAVPKPQVFVIMKFGDSELDSAYEGVMKPVIEEHNLKAIRIDEIQDFGKITDQVLEYIAESKYILADLSGQRPNCYYESGFAHALGKEIIFTIKTSDTIHFDLADYRFIQWSTEAELRRNLRKRFASFEHGEHS
ncbi:MAG TPA: hypothetical protein VF599_20245 [Pyrinomonadaceae bacterium]|jgi:hypothetical protein